MPVARSSGAPSHGRGGAGQPADGGSGSPAGVSVADAGSGGAAADESSESVFEPGSVPEDGTTGNSMGVRFDIYIVKVPWFSLHGVQFKRVSGDSWQYKSLASKILSELNL